MLCVYTDIDIDIHVRHAPRQLEKDLQGTRSQYIGQILLKDFLHYQHGEVLLIL